MTGWEWQEELPTAGGGTTGHHLAPPMWRRATHGGDPAYCQSGILTPPPPEGNYVAQPCHGQLLCVSCTRVSGSGCGCKPARLLLFQPPQRRAQRSPDIRSLPRLLISYLSALGSDAVQHEKTAVLFLFFSFLLLPFSHRVEHGPPCEQQWVTPGCHMAARVQRLPFRLACCAAK